MQTKTFQDCTAQAENKGINTMSAPGSSRTVVQNLAANLDH
jgi:hypothetical protein